MHLSIQRFGRRLVLPTCAAAALAAPSAAGAAPVASDLRVEAGGRVLADASYLTDTRSLPTDTGKPACGGTGQRKTLTGPTALGLLASGSALDPEARPLRITDKFSFGLLVCGVGAFTAGDSAFWLYKVDHMAPEVGGDAFKLKGGEQVLWYHQDTALKRNTGDELVVEAPARSRKGEELEVTVSAYAFDGKRTPAGGATVLFGDTAVTADANGSAKAKLSESKSVRAGRGGDIPSAPLRVCVAEDLGDCPSVRGKRIFGSEGADRLTGTPGADVIRSGAGNDRIDVRGGNRDRVGCGAGPRDRVRLGRGDRAGRDCEIVNGRRRPAKRR